MGRWRPRGTCCRRVSLPLLHLSLLLPMSHLLLIRLLLAQLLQAHLMRLLLLQLRCLRWSVRCLPLKPAPAALTVLRLLLPLRRSHRRPRLPSLLHRLRLQALRSGDLLTMQQPHCARAQLLLLSLSGQQRPPVVPALRMVPPMVHQQLLLFDLAAGTCLRASGRVCRCRSRDDAVLTAPGDGEDGAEATERMICAAVIQLNTILQVAFQSQSPSLWSCYFSAACSMQPHVVSGCNSAAA